MATGSNIARPATETPRLVYAAAWLLAIDVGLRVFGLSRVQRVLALLEPGSPSREDDVRAAVLEIDAVVRKVARHHVYPMRCLTRSLLVRHLLAGAGIPVDLRIGVRKDHGTFQAHAWIEYRDEPIGEADAVMTFAPLTPHEARR